MDTTPLVALSRRLRAVWAALAVGSLPSSVPDPAQDAMDLLDAITESVRAQPTPERVWLLNTAVSGAMPTVDQVSESVRQLSLVPANQASLLLLEQAMAARSSGDARSGLRLVSDRVIVDVDHSARHDLHTGVQQVVRNAVPIWVRDHRVLPVAWNRRFGHYRPLTTGEARRALYRGDNRMELSVVPAADEMIVPWRTPLLLAEVPSAEACDRLDALARFSPNPVLAVGYDCIPVVSADLMPDPEAPRFVRYLSVLKFARRVAAISSSARAEFAGFASTLTAQGLMGPTVTECVLPTAEVSIQQQGQSATDAGDTGTPLVLSVGSFEPRKNHLSLLYAAERLWRDGYEFDLLLIGGSGWGEEIPGEIARLRRRGRTVVARHRVSDQELAQAYRRARFTVFTSLHEGYGLPVAESLAYGTPVITSNYGSTQEIAENGGAVLVDPRHDEQLVQAMRTLLADDAQIASLRDVISKRPRRSWEEYAAEVWDRVVAPELGARLEKEPA